MLVQFKQSGLAKGQQYQLWTHENHAIFIDPQQHNMLATKINYIHQNPVRAGIVAVAENYVYSSAITYYTNKPSLIQIEPITT